jgi:hypothetical protein
MQVRPYENEALVRGGGVRSNSGHALKASDSSAGASHGGLWRELFVDRMATQASRGDEFGMSGAALRPCPKLSSQEGQAFQLDIQPYHRYISASVEIVYKETGINY